jgi:phenylacetic acid degradation operon negative regulatory protein
VNPPATAPPRALIVTVYGLYSRESAGWLPISGLVRLLAALSVDEPAVRSATSRFKRRGLLVASRRDGVAGYALSETGREILAEGDEHIFTPPEGKLTDGWLLAVFSVPEAERAKRHTLRAQLASLGFGAAAPGVWVAPAHRYQVTRAVLRRLALESYVDLFTAHYHGDVDTRWWDLAGVRLGYERFLETWRHAPATADPLPAWVAVVTDWRRLPYLDPGLPPELLPADWPGGAAAALLGMLRGRWAGPADDRARALLRT